MQTSQSSKKPKILFFITQGHMGGAQRYVFDLTTNLKDEIEPVVAIGEDGGDLGAWLKNAGIQVVIAKKLVRHIHPIKEIASLLELKKIIRLEKPEIIHLNSSKVGILGTFAGKLAGHNNIIFTAHGFHFLEPNNWLIRKISFWLEKFACKFRKKIITVSEFDRQAAIKASLCPPKKLVTIHNGIKLNPPPHEEGKGKVIENNALYDPLFISPSRGGKKRIIGTIAHLYKTKGLIYLIEAAAKIIKKHPEVLFLVIGEGPERKNIEDRILNMGLKDRVYLLGEIKNASQYLSAFDVFVLPSLKEGFPYTILEAMSSGLPIVATTAGGIPEAIRHDKEGLLVAPGNSAALREAIEKILDNPALAEALGSSAKKRSEIFSLEKMVGKTRGLYRNLLGKF